MTLGIGVVGAGLIGSRRAASAAAGARSRLVAVADIDPGRAQSLAAQFGAEATGDWSSLVGRADIDAVAVCTSNDQLATISSAALQAGKHVLCEKPLGRNGTEAKLVAEAAATSGCVAKVGFNLRFHPGLREARNLCAGGALGPLHFVRAVYGHGGRPGYASEWRGDPARAGGGELLDQGVHLLDLSRWILGELTPVAAVTPTWFWEVGPLEDNAFMLLSNESGQLASLHTSWTQWRNRFSFEVFGRDGFVRVEGLGGSYGQETLIHGIRRPESGPPEERTTVFDESDPSWGLDWDDFMDAIETGRSPEVSAEEALAVMQLVDGVYAAARRPVPSR